MKTLKKNELLSHVTSFLKTKGVLLEEGSASQALKSSCSTLTSVINQSNQGLRKAKKELTHGVDAVRQIIHEKTASKPQPGKKPKTKVV
jgi:hypothetical protein